MMAQQNTMQRLIATVSLIACTGLAYADPRIVYTRHALNVDIHDLDVTRSADQAVFRARIAHAADQVCGGRPDQGNRYNQAELTLLLPAYQRCRTVAILRAAAAAKVPAQLLTRNDQDKHDQSK
jgi:UrcA family protein